MKRFSGTISTFGGPGDSPAAGNDRPDWREEGLALFKHEDRSDPQHAGLFLSEDDPRLRIPEEAGNLLPGLARWLDPAGHFIAARWLYKEGFPEGADPEFPVTPGSWLRNSLITAFAPKTNRRLTLRAVDWGPAEKTGRRFDLSPGAATFLGVTTGDVVVIELPEHQGEDTTPLLDNAYKPTDENLWKTNPGGTNPPAHERTGESFVGQILKYILLPVAFTALVRSGSGGLLSRALAWLRGSSSSLFMQIFDRLFSAVEETENEKNGAGAENKALDWLLRLFQGSGFSLNGIFQTLPRLLLELIGKSIVDALNRAFNAQEPGRSFLTEARAQDTTTPLLELWLRAIRQDPRAPPGAPHPD